MRLKPFNPEKELKKINRRYSKKHIIVSFIIMMIMVSIGSSYAIFSIEQQSHTLIKSKVGEFSTGDIKLSVLVDGQSQKKFPKIDTGYVFESATCENGTIGTWDDDAWGFQTIFKNPDKCRLSFIKKYIIKSVGIFIDNTGILDISDLKTNFQENLNSFNLMLTCESSTYDFSKTGIYNVSGCGGIGTKYSYEVTATLANGENVEKYIGSGEVISHSGGTSGDK